jgi:hypothetical protein
MKPSIFKKEGELKSLSPLVFKRGPGEFILKRLL